ncbi:MAG: MOSC domain-containing protein [Anaerolineae bacterium]|jgi:MOSC domain-containing protein YiiM|nr:MOSC domain-containing protein [Anaerolineae bacterium]
MIQLLSIQTGKIQTHTLDNGEVWTSAYIKTPVSGPVQAGRLGLTGDEQQHTKVHGGEHRAILAYPAAHYPRWQQAYGRALPFGSFGENFTLSGLDEDSVCLGDVYQVGDSVRVEVAQPRQPCNQIYKALRLRGIQQQVTTTYRTGWYLRVLAGGMVQAGMALTHLERPYPQWTIRRAHEVMDAVTVDGASARALAECAALSPGWRDTLLKHAAPAD